ncbi:MAG TPA: C40 family peptidase [Candidatus Krumholzibacteria bacterium]|nr:C40 family peptidase [Candidatus Krumholzibacteria bacterium]
MLQRLNDAIAAVLTGRGLDHRTVYARAAVLPPDGSTIEFECSDAGVRDAVLDRLSTSGERVPGLRTTLLPSPGTVPLLVTISSVADIRRQPAHASELVTQSIYGDVLVPLKADGDWFLVRLDDGYLGWIRSWHAAATTPDRHDAFLQVARWRVGTNHAAVLSAPEPRALPVTDLVVGSLLAGDPAGRRGWWEVRLADGKRGFIRSGQIEKRPSPGRPVRRDRLVATGLRFLGIPYLWGGNTPRGFDCSGLIQRIFRLNGLLLPRDSDQQALFGQDKTGQGLGELNPGDLVFFAAEAQRVTHVAMVIPDRRIVHAYGQVIVNSLDPAHPLFAPDLARIWRSSRDPLSSA